MKFLNFGILFFLFSNPVSANSIIGNWEGFFSGTHVHQGVMRINIGKNSCSVYMKQLDSEESLEFHCANIDEKNGVYTFSATKGFSAGSGIIEWKFILSLGVGANNPEVNKKLIGSWIQGMKESDSSNFIGLNSGLMRLKEKNL